jgi:hypothetical protein
MTWDVGRGTWDVTGGGIGRVGSKNSEIAGDRLE